MAVDRRLGPGAPRLEPALRPDSVPTGRRPSNPDRARGAVRLGATRCVRSTGGQPDPVDRATAPALRLQDKPIAEFYADKIVMAVVGAVLPALVGFACRLLTGVVSLAGRPGCAARAW